MVLAFALGAAVLAFWTVWRFPSLGPQTVTPAILIVIVVIVLESPMLSLVGTVVTFAGEPGALLFVVLPALTVLLWASGCLVRSLVALIAPLRR